MKVRHLSFSDAKGGAARASYRIHRALLASGVDSQMLVRQAILGDPSVSAPKGWIENALTVINAKAEKPVKGLLKTQNRIRHSPAVTPSRQHEKLNKSDADVVHLHWINGGMISIAEIGKIQKPVVWTLHDMWAFCGAEHSTEDKRWRTGYRRDNRPDHESGFDLNRWTWKRKRRHWECPFQIVTPSQWLADCVRESALMQDWPVTVIPNPVDTERWFPIQKTLARKLLGLPPDSPLLLFGAWGGGQNRIKGFDLLTGGLNHLRELASANEMELVVFGQMAPEIAPDLGFPVHYTGHLYDDPSLMALYSAADALVVPSRQEAFGQTASEAHACGTPVVAFNNTGLHEIVEHQKTGYLAKAYDVEELANGISWVLQSQENENLGKNARERAERYFSYAVVAEQYWRVYEDVVNSRNRE